MENFVALLIPFLLAIGLLRIMVMPAALALKLAVHSGCGFLCLWILNTASAFTGIWLPINAVTVLTAGFLGLPGIGLIALLEVI